MRQMWYNGNSGGAGRPRAVKKKRDEIPLFKWATKAPFLQEKFHIFQDCLRD